MSDVIGLMFALGWPLFSQLAYYYGDKAWAKRHNIKRDGNFFGFFLISIWWYVPAVGWFFAIYLFFVGLGMFDEKND